MSKQTPISQSTASKNFDPNNPYLFTDEEEMEKRRNDRIEEEKSYGILAENYNNGKTISSSEDEKSKKKYGPLFWIGVILFIIFVIAIVLIIWYVISSTDSDDSDEMTTNEILLATYT